MTSTSTSSTGTTVTAPPSFLPQRPPDVSLKFEDERVFRCRANSRSLRRTLIRLTRQLKNASAYFRPTIRELYSLEEPRGANGDGLLLGEDAHTEAGGFSCASVNLEKLCPEVRHLDPRNVLVEGAARTMDAADVDALPGGVGRPGSATAAVKKLTDKNIAYGCSAFDKPISYYVEVTRGWLLSLCEFMLKNGYSFKYIKNILTIVRTDTKENFPLTRVEFKTFERSILDSKAKYYKHHHIQTDGVYAMSERAYELLRSYCMEYLRAVNEYRMGVDVDGMRMVRTNHFNDRYVLFCYIYLMMYHTGKRIGDICSLTRDNLQHLLDTGDLAILIRKTDRIGRISMAHVDDAENFKTFLRNVVKIMDTVQSVRNMLPFDQFVIRRQLNRIFKICYEKIMQHPKPNGLSFHSLRRRKAGTSFRAGTNLESIRESLDHASSRMTNVYINKFLFDNVTSGVAGSGKGAQDGGTEAGTDRREFADGGSGGRTSNGFRDILDQDVPMTTVDDRD